MEIGRGILIYIYNIIYHILSSLVLSYLILISLQLSHAFCMPWTFNRHISGLKPAWGVHQSHRPKSGAVLGYTYDQIHLGHRRTTRFLKIWSKDFEDLCADRSVDWSTRSFGLQSQPAIDLSRDNPENLQKRS